MNGGNASVCRGNSPGSGRDVGENLIADTSAWSSTTRMSWTLKRLCHHEGKLPLPITTSDDLLDKIFRDIPARSEDLMHTSVRHYERNDGHGSGSL
jgi:hypothetical protein